MTDLQQRLYETKLTLLAVVLLAVGIALMVLAPSVHKLSALDWLPVAEIGSALFTTGVIGIALQYLDARDAEARAVDRLRRVLVESAPAIRDAVIDGFAFSPDALASVTSPAVLEQVVRNCLALELQDDAMATELHAQLLRQAMTPTSRYSDSRLSVSITKAPAEHPGLLRVVLRREYRFRPAVPTLRFSCVTGQEEYAASLRDPETTEVWRVSPTADLDAASPSVFTVTSVAFDGQPLELRRTTRRGSQAVTCRLGEGHSDGAEHHLAYSYEVLVPRDRHSLFFDFGRPTQGLAFELDVDAAAKLSVVQLLDFLGTSAEIRRSRHHDEDGSSQYSFACDGWVLPKAGVTLIWK